MYRICKTYRWNRKCLYTLLMYIEHILFIQNWNIQVYLCALRYKISTLIKFKTSWRLYEYPCNVSGLVVYKGYDLDWT